MTATLPYLQAAPATISFAPGAYVRLEWQPYVASAQELKAVYDHVLRAMMRHGLRSLMSIHNQRPPMPPEVQIWLTGTWIPSAMSETNYCRCAIVEAATPLGRLAARGVAAGLSPGLDYRYFRTEAEAQAWLLA